MVLVKRKVFNWSMEMRLCYNIISTEYDKEGTEDFDTEKQQWPCWTLSIGQYKDLYHANITVEYKIIYQR